MTAPAKPATPTILSIALEAVELGKESTPERFYIHARQHYAALARAYVEVVGALRPFANIALVNDDNPNDTRDMIDMPDFCIQPSDIRKARAALTKENTDG